MTDLERTQAYLQIVNQGENLNRQVSDAIKDHNVSRSLSLYHELCDMYREISSKNAQVGYSATNLAKYIKRQGEHVFAKIKDDLSSRFESTLHGLSWPLPIRQPIPDEKVNEMVDFTSAFSNLLILQKEAEAEEDKTRQYDLGRGIPVKERAPGEPLPSLLAMQLLVKPLILRFRYHFDGQRETNRIDKPEWYFAHIVSGIADHSPFLLGDIQRLLNKEGFRRYNAKNEFTRCYLLVIERKLIKNFPELAVNPQLLSHTIHETIQFDETLKNMQYCPPGTNPDTWKGCVDIILGRKDWFKTWIDVEKEFAMSRYNEVMNSSDVWQIDSANTVDEITPTKSAVLVKDLVESITDRYRPLPNFHQQVRFLLDIQIDILASYHRRISGSIDAFETLGSSLVRAVPGVHQAEGRAMVGVEGLKRLCRQYSSSAFIAKACKEWGDSEFFLELWHEVSERAARKQSKAKEQTHRKRPSSVSSIDEVVNEVGFQSKKLGRDDASDGTLFDEVIALFDKTSARIVHLLAAHMSKELLAAMKPYSKIRRWGQKDPLAVEQESADDADQIEKISDVAISPELYAPLSHLSSCLSYLASNLPSRTYATVYRLLARDLEDFFFKVVISAQGPVSAGMSGSGFGKGVLSVEGGTQFAIDMIEGTWRTISGASGIANSRTFIAHPESAFRKVRDVCILLSLPSTTGTGNVENQAIVTRYLQTSPQPIHQVVTVVFDSDKNDMEVKEYLEGLGVYTTSREQAKELLRRRTECWR